MNDNNKTFGGSLDSSENFGGRRPLKKGEFLGEHDMFRLEKFIGHGGMGVVWLATEIQGGKELRQVVCKIVPPAVQKDRAEMEKIEHVFSLIKNLNHTNICPTYGMYNDRDYGWFIVMGYADGGNLLDWFHRFPDYEKGLPLEKILPIIRPLAEGLDEAHKAKVIHRDIKPENVMFNKRADGSPVPWLIDFGLAARIHETLSMTGGNLSTSGTPVYMPPEQWEGEMTGGSQDGRTDQYSLAVMVYQFLNGKPPFTGNQFALMNQILNVVPAPIEKLPPSVNAALLKALSKKKEDRFKSCIEFVNSLTSFAGQKRQRRLKIFISSLVFCLLIAAGAVMTARFYHKKQPSVSPPPAPTKMVAGNASNNANFRYKKEGDHIEITGYDGDSVRDIVIPGEIENLPVTKIGDSAFEGYIGLRSVTFPDSVKEIGYGAFAACYHLEITVSETNPHFTNVDGVLFSKDKKTLVMIPFKIKNFTIPDSVTTIGTNAFSVCDDHLEITVSEENPRFTNVDGVLFSKDKKTLVRVPFNAGEFTIPSGVTRIGPGALNGCRKLRKITIPDSATTIGDNAFAWCFNLTSVTIPDSVTQIGDRAFNLCSSLTTITIPGSVTQIGASSFSGCFGLTSVTIPDGVTEIGGSAFAGCRGLTSVSIPESAKVNNTAFIDCPNLKITKRKAGETDEREPKIEESKTPEIENSSLNEAGKTAGEKKTLTVKGIDYTFCWCPPGTFMMGSPESEEGHRSSEKQHRVTLSHGFWMLESEVTVGMYRQFVEETGHESGSGDEGKGGWGYTNDIDQDSQYTWRDNGFSQGENHPVANVDWKDAVAFCDWLSQKSGHKIALPTEAQWEYACRAGTTTPFNFGSVLNGDQANCDGNNPYGTKTKGPNLKKTSPVKSYSANGWGLYDMHGNVWEWCSDWFDSGYYENPPGIDPIFPNTGLYLRIRGGSWINSAVGCRSAYRGGNDPAYRYGYLGFRLTLVPASR